MPSNNSKYSEEMRTQTAEHILRSGKSATSVAEELGIDTMLEQYGIRSSMSRPGCPYDNSCAESLFATIKKECIYRKKYATLEEVKTDVFECVELFYNRKRMHASLGYLSPVEFRLKNDGLKTA